MPPRRSGANLARAELHSMQDSVNFASPRFCELPLYGVLRSSSSGAKIARLGDAAFTCVLLPYSHAHSGAAIKANPPRGGGANTKGLSLRRGSRVAERSASDVLDGRRPGGGIARR